MQQAATYQQRSRELLAKAFDELDDDLGQASEKGWGAAAEIIKAAAEQRGMFHRSHNALHIVIDSLASETGDQDLRRLFAVASSLHINFYENLYGHQWVESSIQDVEQFVAKVEALLSPNP